MAFGIYTYMYTHKASTRRKYQHTRVYLVPKPLYTCLSIQWTGVTAYFLLLPFHISTDHCLVFFTRMMNLRQVRRGTRSHNCLFVCSLHRHRLLFFASLYSIFTRATIIKVRLPT